MELGRPAEVARHAQGALDIALKSGNPAWEGSAALCHGMVLQQGGHSEAALAEYQRSASIHRRLGNLVAEITAWDLAGTAYRDLGRHEEAVGFHRHALSACRELGDAWRSAVVADHLAAALAPGGFEDEARVLWREVGNLLVAFDDPRAIALRERTAEYLLPGSAGRAATAQWEPPRPT